ncbi:MAG: arylsulfotransferase family protein, partial [Candidatus Eisenbacteria bacterium]
PVTETVKWQYIGDPPRSFYSEQKGSAQRLPNGNTLICDGDNGRAIEVTMAGEIVWEWLNPATEEGRRVQVYRMIRLDPGVVEPLLE